MTTDTRAYLALLESDRASLAATVVALEAERDEAIKQRDLWRDDAALRAQNADLWKKRHESDTAELRQHESVWRRAAGALEAERDEARAQVAALREALAMCRSGREPDEARLTEARRLEDAADSMDGEPAGKQHRIDCTCRDCGGSSLGRIE